MEVSSNLKQMIDFRLQNPTKIIFIKKKFTDLGTKINFYFQILMNSMCMQCHGKPAVDIENSTLAAIKANYPVDKATGYGVNEIRGMWKVVFD